MAKKGFSPILYLKINKACTNLRRQKGFVIASIFYLFQVFKKDSFLPLKLNVTTKGNRLILDG
jgi:hypothetical protein